MDQLGQGLRHGLAEEEFPLGTDKPGQDFGLPLQDCKAFISDCRPQIIDAVRVQPTSVVHWITPLLQSKCSGTEPATALLRPGGRLVSVFYLASAICSIFDQGRGVFMD